MNGYQRIQAALRGEQPDHPPVMLHHFMHAAREAHVTMAEFRQDPRALARSFLAIRQLLGNAVKYSPPETTIAISASQAGDTVTIAVRDHGPGIPPDELDAIFERFYRGKQTLESVAGTGMGLSIARDIVRAHDGKLRVQNTPEGGAQFSFTLPAFHEVQLS